MRNRRLLLMAAGLPLFALVLALQWASGAYSVEFGANSDEPAHYVTGLMIHDYLVAGFPAPPVAFAENFYYHYPKVAFGIWPPLFHVVEAAWMLLFSTSRVSVLLLMCLLTTLLAWSLYWAVSRIWSFAWALGAAVFLVGISLTQTVTMSVMADSLQALALFWAMVSLIRFLERRERRDAILLGIAVALSLLTKANGMALVVVIPLALLLSHRVGVLRLGSWWQMTLLVAVLAGPWQYLSYRLLRSAGFTLSKDWSTVWSTASAATKQITDVAGAGIVLLALTGVVFRAVLPALRKDGASPRWAAVGALAIGYPAFHLLLPHGFEPRYWLSVVPALVLLALAGAEEIVRRLPTGPFAARLVMAVLCLIVLAPAVAEFRIPRKRRHGVEEIVAHVLRQRELDGAVFLVISGPVREGVVVSEFARQEERPGHFVLRGSKVVSSSGWHGENYRLLHRTPGDLTRFLTKVPVNVLLMDRRDGTARPEIREQVEAVVNGNAAQWEALEGFGGEEFKAYRLRTATIHPRERLDLTLDYRFAQLR